MQLTHHFSGLSEDAGQHIIIIKGRQRKKCSENSKDRTEIRTHKYIFRRTVQNCKPKVSLLLGRPIYANRQSADK